MSRKPGDVLGDFILRERAGGGPASELWKAVHQDDPARLAAVRFFVEGRGVPPLRVKADVLRALDHPNIARVDEVDMTADAPYLRREWVDHRAGAEIRDCAIQVLRALAFAHARGVVHGRLTPADILVGADGRVKVTDFGLEGTSTDPKEDLRALGEVLRKSDPADKAWAEFTARLASGGFASAAEALAAAEALPAPPRAGLPSWIAGPLMIVGVFMIAYVGIGVTFAGLQPSLRLIAAAAGAGLCAVAWRYVERPRRAAVFWGALLWGFGARVQGLSVLAGAWGVAAVAGGLWLKGGRVTPKA
jgi:hypothetical protein